jgi:hypothetical protein
MVFRLDDQEAGVRFEAAMDLSQEAFGLGRFVYDPEGDGEVDGLFQADGVGPAEMCADAVGDAGL